MNKNPDDNKWREHEQHKMYLDYRQGLVNSKFKVAEDFDKALLTLSGGALGISMAFIKDIVTRPEYKWILVISWACFGLAIIILLLGFHVCRKAYTQEIVSLDARQKESKKTNSKKNAWSEATEVANILALIIFIIGLFLLATFIFVNIENFKGSENEQRTNTSETKYTQTSTSASAPKNSRTACTNTS